MPLLTKEQRVEGFAKNIYEDRTKREVADINISNYHIMIDYHVSKGNIDKTIGEKLIEMIDCDMSIIDQKLQEVRDMI